MYSMCLFLPKILIICLPNSFSNFTRLDMSLSNNPPNLSLMYDCSNFVIYCLSKLLLSIR